MKENGYEEKGLIKKKIDIIRQRRKSKHGHMENQTVEGLALLTR